MEFSVLISVYEKESASNFDRALKSCLVDQTRVPEEIVIVKDGPLTNELESVLNKYVDNYGKIIKIIALDVNRGLGNALKIGLKSCTHDIVARMDSDDINYPDRFSKQLDYLYKNPEVSVVGGYITEFFKTINSPEYIRKTPISHQDISKMLKRRNPMNHVSVMFRKNDILDSGSYLDLPYLEDYYLWARVINKGYRLANMDEELVYVRTGEGMFARRSNKDYISSWKELQVKMRDYKLISTFDYYINIVNIYAFINIPPKLKKIVYKHFLRSEK